MPSMTFAEKVAMIPPPAIAMHPAYRSSRDIGQIGVLQIPEPPASLYEANVRGSGGGPRSQRSLDFVLPSVRKHEKRLVPATYSRRRPSTSSSTYRRRSSACSYSSFAALQRCQARQPSRVDPSLEKAGYCYSMQNSLRASDAASSSSSSSGDERESKPVRPTEQLRSFFSMKMRRARSSANVNASPATSHPFNLEKRATAPPTAPAPTSASRGHRRLLGDILGRHTR